MIGEGAFSLTSIKSGGTQEMQISIYNKGKGAGSITFQVTFQLDPTTANLPEILAPNTKGQVIFKPING